jgi:radical SAM superfamily enzyme YgiQ (UPF0313 family)
MFCLTAVSSQIPLITKIAKIIKKKRDVFILLGGVHATLNPESAIEIPNIDAICIGEGEVAVVELADVISKPKLLIHGINNIWMKSGKYIDKGETSDFIKDLDLLPVIDRMMWYPYILDVNSRPSVLVGRGCPNKCTYCSNHALSKISGGTYVRFRSPDSIVNEIYQILRGNPSINEIYLEVETLSINLDYAYSLLDKLRDFNSDRQTPIKFGINLSMTKKIMDNREFIEKLKSANITSINIGLESGSEKVRKYVLNRPPYTNEEITSFCNLVREYGIFINMYVIVGIPGESRENFQETIECVRKCKPNFVQIGVYYPYPGTVLYNIARSSGLFNDDILETSAERGYPMFDLPNFSKREIRWEYIMFYVKAMKGIMPMSSILKYTFINLIAPYPKVGRFIKEMLIKVNAQKSFVKKKVSVEE